MLLFANLVAIFHGLVMVGLFAGPILMFQKNRSKKMILGFVILAGLTAFSFIITGACFLTTLEKNLRAYANVPSYNTGFVRHYLSLIGIDIPDITTTIIISLLIIIVVVRFIWLKVKKQ